MWGDSNYKGSEFKKWSGGPCGSCRMRAEDVSVVTGGGGQIKGSPQRLSLQVRWEVIGGFLR